MLRSFAKRNLVYLGLAFLFFGLGYYNFNFQFIKPLTSEYQLFHSTFRQGYKATVSNVYFIRTDEKAFQKTFGIRSANDEIGRPSTSRDWVPEHLVKQTVFEITNSRKKADQIKVFQFANKDEYLKQHLTITPEDLVIDMNELILNK